MKKLSLVVFLPVVLILLAVIQHAPRADPLIRSWSQFNSDLSNTNDKHASLDDFLRNSPSYRTLVKEGDERVFREMVAQGPIPFVPIVGFLGLNSTVLN